MNRQALLPILALSIVAALLQGCAAAVVAGAATGAAVAHDRRSLGAIVDDNTIELKAGGALRSDTSLRDQAHINVTSFNGIVLLSGEATTSDARDRVLALVREVPSIRRINNEIRIAPLSSMTDRTRDSLITGNVKTRLVGARDLDPTRVKVVTENSVVYLMGLVTQKEGEVATSGATAAGGVERVVKLFEYVD